MRNQLCKMLKTRTKQIFLHNLQVCSVCTLYIMSNFNEIDNSLVLYISFEEIKIKINPHLALTHLPRLSQAVVFNNIFRLFSRVHHHSISSEELISINILMDRYTRSRKITCQLQNKQEIQQVKKMSKLA